MKKKKKKEEVHFKEKRLVSQLKLKDSKQRKGRSVHV